ncbi:glycosyltransferase family 9 protein, partial [Bordetella pertussis]
MQSWHYLTRAALAQRAALVVCNDSGVSHVAA